MNALVLLGRVLFAAIFVGSAPGHFKAETVSYAASQGVPWAGALVPVSGAIALVGGLCVALGWRTKLGGWMLAAFLLPVTFMMHDFWTLSGPESLNQFHHFMKNLSMLGGALIFASAGSGPYSLDERRGQRLYLDEREAADRRESVALSQR